MAAISSRATAIGEAFHAVSDKALTLRGYAESMSRWFGHEPNLEFLPYVTNGRLARTPKTRKPHGSILRAARIARWKKHRVT